MRKFSRAVEKSIFDRDKGICQICGRETDFGDGDIDHILSVSRGGSNEHENLQWACHKCNNLKGKDRSNEQVRRILGLPESFEEITKSRTKKRTQMVDLKNELEKVYGPIYSVLSKAVCTEVKTGILTPREKKLMDEAFSKEPFILDSQMEWKNKIRNRPIRNPLDIDIPMRFIEYFNEEYERKNAADAVKERFCDIYSMFKRVPQKVEEVGILLPHEKSFIDEKLSTYPFMISQELYDYWNKEIRSLEITVGYEAFEHKITLLENSRISEEETVQKMSGVYRVPRTFITEFLKEYNNKVRECKKL
jgi:hypothetical protein